MEATVISALRKTAEGLTALAEALESGAIGVPDPPNLTVKDVAVLLACAEDTIRSAVHREGDPIPAIHVGSLLRFRRSEVEKWASRQRPTGKEPVRRVSPIGIKKARRRS